MTRPTIDLSAGEAAAGYDLVDGACDSPRAYRVVEVLADGRVRVLVPGIPVEPMPGRTRPAYYVGPEPDL